MLGAWRAEVLSVAALAVSERQAIPDTLDQAAETLSAFARRQARSLAKQLRAGMPLGRALLRHGVIGPLEARRLDTNSDAGPRLRRLADNAVQPGTGVWQVRWFPVVAVAALLLPGWVFWTMTEWLSGNAISSMYKELGIALPGLAELIFSPLWLQVPMYAAILAVFAVPLLLVREIALIRHLTHVWCPEVHRCWFAWRLVRALGPGDDVPYPLPWYRVALDALFIGIHPAGKPRWHADWCAWLFLSRFRLPKNDRRMLREVHGLSLRLAAIGLLGEGREAPHHAEEVARERLAQAVQDALPLLHAALLILGTIGLAVGVGLPLAGIIENISGGI